MSDFCGRIAFWFQSLVRWDRDEHRRFSKNWNIFHFLVIFWIGVISNRRHLSWLLFYIRRRIFGYICTRAGNTATAVQVQEVGILCVMCVHSRGWFFFFNKFVECMRLCACARCRFLCICPLLVWVCECVCLYLVLWCARVATAARAFWICMRGRLYEGPLTR